MRRACGIRCRNDHGDGDLVADRIRGADNGDVGDNWVLAQDLFDLDHRHVLAGDLEHVGVAAVEDEAAVVVAVGAVAGAEPAVAERGRRRDRVVEVAGEQRDARFAADDDLAVVELDRGTLVSRSPSCRSAGRRARSVSTAGIVSVIPYSWRGRQPSQLAIVSYCAGVRFWAYQQWRSRNGGRSGEAGPPRARIMRIGPANRLAHVAPWRAAWSTKRLAENVGISATLAPTAIAAANE